MPVRNITGPLYKPGTNTPWINTVVQFKLTAIFANNGIGYPKDTHRVITDINGNFAVSLAVPDSGAAQWQIIFSDNTRIDYALGIGSDLTIADIINAGTFPGSPNQLQQLLDSFTFTDLLDTPNSYSGKALNFVRVNASGTGLELVELGTGSDSYFRHIQSVAASVWTVDHALDKFPSVTVVNSAGDEVIGDINHVSVNQCIISFSGSFSGEVYCN